MVPVNKLFLGFRHRPSRSVDLSVKSFLNSCSGETRSFVGLMSPQNPRFQQNMSLGVVLRLTVTAGRLLSSQTEALAIHLLCILPVFRFYERMLDRHV